STATYPSSNPESTMGLPTQRRGSLLSPGRYAVRIIAPTVLAARPGGGRGSDDEPSLLLKASVTEPTRPELAAMVSGVKPLPRRLLQHRGCVCTRPRRVSWLCHNALRSPS